MSDKRTSWGQEVVWPIVPTMYGQGSYGYECEICKANDWAGPIEHKPGCSAASIQVKKVRDNPS